MVVEEVAAEFGMSTKVAVDRLTTHNVNQQLRGVFDDDAESSSTYRRMICSASRSISADRSYEHFGACGVGQQDHGLVQTG